MVPNAVNSRSFCLPLRLGEGWGEGSAHSREAAEKKKSPHPALSQWERVPDSRPATRGEFTVLHGNPDRGELNPDQ